MDDTKRARKHLVREYKWRSPVPPANYNVRGPFSHYCLTVLTDIILFEGFRYTNKEFHHYRGKTERKSRRGKIRLERRTHPSYFFFFDGGKGEVG